MTAPTPEELVERLARIVGRETNISGLYRADTVRALLAEIHKLGLRIVPTLANNAMILAIRDETNAEMTESISAWNSALAAAPNYTGGAE